MFGLRIIPRSFLYFIPLHIGAEVIGLTALANHMSAFYALGALFTGHPLTVMEWVVNLITVALLPFFFWGYSAIRRKRPLGVLAYAYLYTLDTFMSLGFTIYFIVYWFTVGTKKANQVNSSSADTSAIFSSSVNGTTVAATASRTRVLGALPTHTASTVRYVARDAAEAAKSLNKSAALGQELAVTIVVTTLVLVARFYFMLVIIGYARRLVQQYNLRSSNGEPVGSRRALFQRIMIAPWEKFWTGRSAYAPLPSAQPDKVEDDMDTDVI